MRILIIGATSGIGNALALHYARDKRNEVIIAGRRLEILNDMAMANPNFIPFQLDIAGKTDNTYAISKLGTIDLAILTAGIGDLNPEFEFGIEETTLVTNVFGWARVINCLWHIFENQNYGHIVAITSTGGYRGEPLAPSYSASKAFQINYLEALRKKSIKGKHRITITDIRPGLVDTAMAKGENLFWVMPIEKVTNQIIKIIKRKKKHGTVTKRWKIVAFVLRFMPDYLYDRI